MFKLWNLLNFTLHYKLFTKNLSSPVYHNVHHIEMNLIFCLKICKWNSLEFTKSSLRFSSLYWEDDVQRGSLENWDCALSVTPLYREAGGEEGARTGLLGEGVWCAPSVHWCCACALSILLEGRGPPHVWGKESYKRGGFIHSLPQLLCDYSVNPDNSSGVWLVNLWTCELVIFLLWNTVNFLWTFPKVKWML